MRLGTVFSETGKKALLCGAGELGKEVAIELLRYGVEVVVADRYENPPAALAAKRSYKIAMTDGKALREVVEREKPDYIIPEIEAIATSELVELERDGYFVIPTAKAAALTMNREGIRRLAAEELSLPTSHYVFAESLTELLKAVEITGFPCVVKPVMSSSGHGQSVVKRREELTAAWETARKSGRVEGCKVIVEGFINFDYEITLLTLRSVSGTSFLPPVGHIQIDGDYRESWQPHPMSKNALEKAQEIALTVTDALGGRGIFGVELFIKGDEVYFSEVSPRPHDTGMVTMISQEFSEFALHVRAILGLPVPEIKLYEPSASRAVLAYGKSDKLVFDELEKVLEEAGTDMRIFGKPSVDGHRRMAVVLARGDSVEAARAKCKRAWEKLKLVY